MQDNNGKDSGKLSIDERVKLAELALKTAEIKSKSGWRSLTSTPLLPILLTALAGFVVDRFSNIAKNDGERVLEREKLRSSLILKMSETGDYCQTAKNLLFLVDMKLIEDTGDAISKLRKNPKASPVTFTAVSKAPVDLQLKYFFDLYRQHFGAVSPSQVTAISTLLGFVREDESINDYRFTAYVLAVIQYETGNTFRPIHEFGGTEYLEKRYGPESRFGKNLGNTGIGDGYLFRGRGYIQITGRHIYAKLSERLGIDLITDPDAALDPFTSYKIASSMLIEGLLTGKKLSDYITATSTDYVGARRVTNGFDKAEVIGAQAKIFEDILTKVLVQSNECFLQVTTKQ